MKEEERRSKGRWERERGKARVDGGGSEGRQGWMGYEEGEDKGAWDKDQGKGKEGRGRGP